MNALRLAAGLTAAVTVLMFALVQFLPWGGFSGFGADVDGYPWEMKASFGGDSDSRSWYSDDLDGEDGTAQIKTGAIFLAVALAAFVGGAVLLLLLGRVGSFLAFAGVVLAITGTILMSTGLDDLFDGEQEWGAGFVLAIVGIVLGAIAGALGMLPERFAPRLVSKGGPSF